MATCATSFLVWPIFDVGEGVAWVWSKARAVVLTAEEVASTWLAGGVPSTQVAERAGYSVAVLHQIYAKVIAGQGWRKRDRAPDRRKEAPRQVSQVRGLFRHV
jgi:hypothetical protein